MSVLPEKTVEHSSQKALRGFLRCALAVLARPVRLAVPRTIAGAPFAMAARAARNPFARVDVALIPQPRRRLARARDHARPEKSDPGDQYPQRVHDPEPSPFRWPGL